MAPKVPEPGEERPDEDMDFEVEILHLSKRKELDGIIYDREVSYLSDHQIFHRLAINGIWTPWEYWKLWEKIDQIYEIAEKKKAMGWKLEWHPNYQSLLGEFIKEARF